MVVESGSILTPRPLVALAWGSKSTTSVRFRETPREAPRLTAVVVFPPPPFWLAMHIILPTAASLTQTDGKEKRSLKPVVCLHFFVARLRVWVQPGKRQRIEQRDEVLSQDLAANH